MADYRHSQRMRQSRKCVSVRVITYSLEIDHTQSIS